jgi:hypothetical protein
MKTRAGAAPDTLHAAMKAGVGAASGTVGYFAILILQSLLITRPQTECNRRRRDSSYPLEV